jgi:hypothetical protein
MAKLANDDKNGSGANLGFEEKLRSASVVLWGSLDASSKYGLGRMRSPDICGGSCDEP